MNASPKTTQPSQAPTRITGPAGTRLVVPGLRGLWRIQWETGPSESDPLCETKPDALEWARELVNAKGTPFPPPRRRSPNENPDALAKTVPKTPVVLSRRPLATGVIGRYEYSAADKPLRRSR